MMKNPNTEKKKNTFPDDLFKYSVYMLYIYNQGEAAGT